MAKHGKRYTEAASLIEEGRDYSPEEAISIAKKAATAKFDETVELHIRTGADPRHADQMVRGVTTLPHGIGKPVRVLVFTQGEAVIAAERAGADFVGGDDMVKKVEGGWTDFDVSIATPDMMGRIGKLGRILGRRGLMPNPRSGTVVQPGDIPDAVREAKKGRVELRMDRTAIIHSPLGKASFEDQRLIENLAAVVDTVKRLRPSGVKGQFVKAAHLPTTMGPGVPVDLAASLTLKAE